MGLSIRRERFLRVKERRVENALAAIESLENLSNKTNYEFNQTEVDEMYGLLLAQLKNVFASFFSNSDKEKYEQLIRADQLQYELLKTTEPGVYSFIERDIETASPRESTKSEDIKNIIRASRAKFTEQAKQIESLKTKLMSLEKIVESSSKKLKRIETHGNFSPDSTFILNPSFEIEEFRDHKQHKRFLWMKNGRTYKQIIAKNSPYNKVKNFTKAEDCLAWDIRHKRIMQMS
tara:strand:+ start:863 stop:1564 length:702 start_codon:yes stop_codon:yes gene_type:complete